MSTNLIYYAVPVFILLMLLEWRVIQARQQQPAHGLRGYQRRDTITSLSLALLFAVANIGWKVLALAAMFALQPYAMFSIGFTDLWAWPLVLLCEDFFYYWYHRCVHRLRIGWAAHVTHHSSEFFNFSTGLRQPVTTPIFKILFYLPIVLIGFDPLMVALAVAINQLYQYWIHTETIGNIGRLEWLFNTASHHRVHHGRNKQYLDKNFGGVLIIWDRIFDTFEPEQEKVDFGLVKPIRSHNLLWVSFHEVIALWQAMQRTPRLTDKLRRLIKPPDWEPAGNASGTEAKP